MWHYAQELNTDLARESEYLQKIWKDVMELVTGIMWWQYSDYMSH